MECSASWFKPERLFRVPRVGCFRRKLHFATSCQRSRPKIALVRIVPRQMPEIRSLAFASFTERQGKALVKWKIGIKEEKHSAASLTGDADDEGCGLCDHRRRPGRVDRRDLPGSIQAERRRIRWREKPSQSDT